MRLEVRGIKKSFGDKEVLHGISFEVASGRAMGFLGRNGAGKSTTIRCLMDVFHQDEGGFYMNSAPLDIKKHRVGYLPEERGLYPTMKALKRSHLLAPCEGCLWPRGGGGAGRCWRNTVLAMRLIARSGSCRKAWRSRCNCSALWCMNRALLFLTNRFPGWMRSIRGVWKR